MMARSAMLQRKAGYIDARPLTAELVELSCNARPDHTWGQFGAHRKPLNDRLAPILLKKSETDIMRNANYLAK